MTSSQERPAIDLSRITAWDAVLIRTDYANGDAWRQVAAGMRRPWGDTEPSWHVVSDAGWAGAQADDVLAALPDDVQERHDVVFLADAYTMTVDHTPLLAVSTDPDLRDQDHEIPGLGFTSRFRILPTAVGEMVVNLALGNMDYEDFSSAAHGDAQKIHRGFLTP